MTRLLEQAFEKATRLPEHEQDAIGEWLISELESEACWGRLLAGSQDALAKLAEEALAEHRRGETEELDPGR